MLVYGDTNSTLAGARAAAQAAVPLAHVEAGLRSGDLAMPEEHARIEVDRIAWLLFCPDDRSRATLTKRASSARSHVVGDVMAEASPRFRAHRARARFRSRSSPGATSSPRSTGEANVYQPRLGRIIDGLNRLQERVVFPAHPRTRAPIARRGSARGARRSVTEPLGYLELAVLASQARVIVDRLRAACRRRRTGTACRA